MIDLDELECDRVALQNSIDRQQLPKVRNTFGQFPTPTVLAREIVSLVLSNCGTKDGMTFIEPGFGTGAFTSALLYSNTGSCIKKFIGYELDDEYYAASKKFWSAKAKIDVRNEDFTEAAPSHDDLADMIICNPPYVRHHHISSDDKKLLQKKSESVCGIRLNGLSGLYCYFMALCHQWLKPEGIACWLIPSEFMDVNYGQMLKEYLLKKVTLLRVHRFNPEEVQFGDALVSSSVVLYAKAVPKSDYDVQFTYGGTLLKPAHALRIESSRLLQEKKWIRFLKEPAHRKPASLNIGDLFKIRRGLATGGNDFFILDRDRIREFDLPIECFTPILPGSRFVKENEIFADENGNPLLEKQLFLLNTRLSEDEISRRYPSLKSYLDIGKKGKKPISKGYLCQSRHPWYAQENRPHTPFMCTYMGRVSKSGGPFRFILNHSMATATNTYLLLYPQDNISSILNGNNELVRIIWEHLNMIPSDELYSNGRVYGGGMQKLEPKELQNVDISSLHSILRDYE